ncbi:predicted protein [Coccidioides posadasii str. Silveira]|uniref:Predicted protein n=2 Tax=Coccidioides posadasii TaxID=199306 RepID=E9DDW7_COCPS|nr:predicted protein [Coccidioides posadasii str. Silveira]KMM70253.1 hypothetical protein CPAG_06564 [Coccidioides posadasii RMSCC 3488]
MDRPYLVIKLNELTSVQTKRAERRGKGIRVAKALTQAEHHPDIHNLLARTANRTSGHTSTGIGAPNGRRLGRPGFIVFVVFLSLFFATETARPAKKGLFVWPLPNSQPDKCHARPGFFLRVKGKKHMPSEWSAQPVKIDSLSLEKTLGANRRTADQPQEKRSKTARVELQGVSSGRNIN